MTAPTTETATPMIGDNNPPEPIEETPLEKAIKTRDKLIATAERWINERPEITDELMAEKAKDFLAQLAASENQLEALRKVEKKPFDDITAEIQQRFRDLKAPIGTAIGLISPRLEAYLQRKREEHRERLRQQQADANRLAQEAEKRRQEAAEKARQAAAGETVDDPVDVVGSQLAAEQAARDAAAAQKKVQTTAAQPTNVRGQIGSAKGLRTVWSATIEDYDKALEHFKDHPDVRDCVQNIANGLARSPAGRGMAVPGVRFVSDERL